MKKTKSYFIYSLVLIFLVFIMTFSVSAESEGIYNYKVTGGETTIESVDPSVTSIDTTFTGELVIPDTLGGYPVTAIGDEAFLGARGFESIVLPDSVKSIGRSAFGSCYNLETINIPDCLEYIGDNAFDMCKLESLTIPASVKYIGDSAFYATAIKEIVVDENNENYSSDEYGVLFNKDKTLLIKYPCGNDRKSYEVPDSVMSIDRNSFTDCRNLETVNLPETITEIPPLAFETSSIIHITIPDSVTKICRQAFSQCFKLKSVTFGSGIKTIEHDAFLDCEFDEIDYNGTIGQWKNVNIAYSNFNLINAEVNCKECTNHSFTRYYSDLNATVAKNGTKTAYCDNLCGASHTVEDENSKIILGKVYELSAIAKTDSVTLKWYMPEGATGCIISVFENNKWKELNTTEKREYKVTGLKSGTKYSFSVRAFAEYDGERVVSVDHKIIDTITKPVAPKTVKAKTQTTTSITLTWSKTTGATGYRVYQYSPSKDKYVLKKSVKGITTYKVTGLKAGTSYKFKIKPYVKDDDGTVIWGSASSAFATATKPATPTLKVSAASGRKATLSWTNVSGETGYQVYYSTSKSGSYKKMESVSANKVKYTTSKLTAGKTYYFKVRAYKKVDGKTIFGSFSSIKSVKIK